MTVTLTVDHWIAADRRVFVTKKDRITGALQGETGIVDGVTEENKEDIFYMLMFCLCVPQSKAVKAEEAIEQLQKHNFYTAPLSLEEVTKTLAGHVRFHPTKAKRLIEARETFLETDFWKELTSRYRVCCEVNEVCAKQTKTREEIALHAVRNFLIAQINGMGMKLASHFMRNIGMRGLAILDVHVLSGLKKRGVIDTDKLLGSSRTEYENAEQKMKDYADSVGISLDELDLLLWSQKTGFVFK